MELGVQQKPNANATTSTKTQVNSTAQRRTTRNVKPIIHTTTESTPSKLQRFNCESRVDLPTPQMATLVIAFSRMGVPILYTRGFHTRSGQFISFCSVQGISWRIITGRRSHDEAFLECWHALLALATRESVEGGGFG
jgi:hypothetical protein